MLANKKLSRHFTSTLSVTSIFNLWHCPLFPMFLCQEPSQSQVVSGDCQKWGMLWRCSILFECLLESSCWWQHCWTITPVIAAFKAILLRGEEEIQSKMCVPPYDYTTAFISGYELNQFVSLDQLKSSEDEGTEEIKLKIVIHLICEVKCTSISNYTQWESIFIDIFVV